MKFRIGIVVAVALLLCLFSPELFVTKYGENRHSLTLKLVVLLEQLSIRYANKVLTVNEALRKRFIERGAHAPKISIVRNVPDEGLCTTPLPQSNKKGFTLLTHGTILQRYGQEVIVRALPLIRSQIEDLHLLIVGDGENTEQVRSLVAEHDCSDIVTFTGRVPFSEIGEFISAADIGMVPLLHSPFSELCQPNKLFEYVACRKPVIASRLQAIEETFDNSCVMFFEPGNYKQLASRILELYHSPKKRNELVENAFRRYQEVRWGETKKAYLKAVEDLVKTKQA